MATLGSIPPRNLNRLCGRPKRTGWGGDDDGKPPRGDGGMTEECKRIRTDLTALTESIDARNAELLNAITMANAELLRNSSDATAGTIQQMQQELIEAAQQQAVQTRQQVDAVSTKVTKSIRDENTSLKDAVEQLLLEQEGRVNFLSDQRKAALDTAIREAVASATTSVAGETVGEVLRTQLAQQLQILGTMIGVDTSKVSTEAALDYLQEQFPQIEAVLQQIRVTMRGLVAISVPPTNLGTLTEQLTTAAGAFGTHLRGLEQLKTQRGKLLAKLTELEASNAELVNQERVYRAQVDKLTAELAEVRGQHKVLTNELAAARLAENEAAERLRIQDTRFASLTASYQEALAKSAANDAEKIRLGQVATDLRAKINDLTVSEAAATSKLSLLQADLDDKSAKLQAAEAAHQEVVNELAGRQRHLDVAVSEQKAATAQQVALHQQLITSQALVDNNINAHTKAVATLRAQLTVDLRAQQQTHSEELAKLTAEHKATRENIKSQEAIRARIDSAREQDRTLLKAELMRVQRELQANTEYCVLLLGEKSDVASQLQNALLRIGKLETQQQDLAQDYAAEKNNLVMQLEAAQTEVTATGLRTQQLQQALAAAGETNANVAELHAQLALAAQREAGQNAEIQAVKQALKDANHGYEGRVLAIQSDLTRATAAQAEAIGRLDLSEAAQKTLREEMGAVRHHIQTIERNHSELLAKHTAEHVHYSEQLATAQTANNAAHEELRRLGTQTDGLRQQVAELTESRRLLLEKQETQTVNQSEELTRTRTLLAAETTKLSAAEKLLTNASQQINLRTAELAASQQDVGKVQAQLVELERTSSETFRLLRSETTTQQQELTRLQQQLTEFTSANSEKATEIGRLQEQLRLSVTQQQDLQVQIQANIEDNTNVQQEQAEQTERIEQDLVQAKQEASTATATVLLLEGVVAQLHEKPLIVDGAVDNAVLREILSAGPKAITASVNLYQKRLGQIQTDSQIMNSLLEQTAEADPGRLLAYIESANLVPIVPEVILAIWENGGYTNEQIVEWAQARNIADTDDGSDAAVYRKLLNGTTDARPTAASRFVVALRTRIATLGLVTEAKNAADKKVAEQSLLLAASKAALDKANHDLAEAQTNTHAANARAEEQQLGLVRERDRIRARTGQLQQRLQEIMAQADDEIDVLHAAEDLYTDLMAATDQLADADIVRQSIVDLREAKTRAATLEALLSVYESDIQDNQDVLAVNQTEINEVGTRARQYIDAIKSVALQLDALTTLSRVGIAPLNDEDTATEERLAKLSPATAAQEIFRDHLNPALLMNLDVRALPDVNGAGIAAEGALLALQQLMAGNEFDAEAVLRLVQHAQAQHRANILREQNKQADDLRRLTTEYESKLQYQFGFILRNLTLEQLEQPQETAQSKFPDNAPHAELFHQYLLRALERNQLATLQQQQITQGEQAVQAAQQLAAQQQAAQPPTEPYTGELAATSGKRRRGKEL